MANPQPTPQKKTTRAPGRKKALTAEAAKLQIRDDLRPNKDSLGFQMLEEAERVGIALPLNGLSSDARRKLITGK